MSKRPIRDCFGAVLDCFSLIAGLAVGKIEKNREHSQNGRNRGWDSNGLHSALSVARRRQSSSSAGRENGKSVESEPHSL